MVDARDEFAAEYCCPRCGPNALYMDRYPLVSALSRPVIVKPPGPGRKRVRRERRRARLHGQGQRPGRFEVGIAALAPDVKSMAPVRDSGMTRDKAIEFAAARACRSTSRAVAVLGRPERLGPEQRDRAPGGHLGSAA